MSDPYKKLVSVLEGRMTGLANKATAGLPSELGTMTASGLKLDSFSFEIPDYMVAEWQATLELPAFSLVGQATSPVSETGAPQGSATTAPRARYDFLPKELAEVGLRIHAGLKTGDRVLAIPVNGGKEAVVLCKVVKPNG